jgi:hypothetical protein
LAKSSISIYDEADLLAEVRGMPDPAPEKKPPLGLAKSIILLIILTFVVVTLFGLMVFLFTRRAQAMGLPVIVNLTIFVIISGIFAWLLKRLTDIGSGMSQLWFPEDEDETR